MIKFISSDHATCVSSQISIEEFNYYATDIIDSYSKKFNQLERQPNNLNDIINNSGIIDERINELYFSSSGLDIYFTDIVQSILSSFINPASFRVINKIAPAHLKSEFKDCVIWETFLELMRSKSTYEIEALLIPSNKSGFCLPQDANNFHPELMIEVSRGI